MNLHDLTTHAPWLAAIGGALLAPSPLEESVQRVIFRLPLKGATPMPNLEQVQTYINEAKDLAKVAISVIPGATPQEKAAKLLGLIEPAVTAECEKLGCSPFVTGLLVKLIELVVNEEVPALA